MSRTPLWNLARNHRCMLWLFSPLLHRCVISEPFLNLCKTRATKGPCPQSLLAQELLGKTT